MPQYHTLRTARYFNYVVALVVYKQLKNAMHKTQTLGFLPVVKPKGKGKAGGKTVALLIKPKVRNLIWLNLSFD